MTRPNQPMKSVSSVLYQARFALGVSVLLTGRKTPMTNLPSKALSAPMAKPYEV